MSEKERFLNVLSGEPVDRPPFIAPGALILEPFAEALTRGFKLEKLKSSPDALAELSLFMRKEAGFENVGMPFLIRLESASYHGEPDEVFSGSKPLEFAYPLKDVSDYKGLSQNKEPLRLGLDTIRILSSKAKDTPVIADVCGPVSLAASLLDGKTLLKSMAKDPLGTRGLLEFLAKNTVAYAVALKKNGADAVFISDNFSTALTLGKPFFREYALCYLNVLCGAIREAGCLSIVHLCSDVTGLTNEIKDLRADCVSVDSETSLRPLKAALPGKRIMGNIKVTPFYKGGLGGIKAEAFSVLPRPTPLGVGAPKGETEGISGNSPLDVRQEVSAFKENLPDPCLMPAGASIIGPSCGITREARLSCFREVKDILSGYL
ncbi:MAG: uroporphyrinogen decarboxylase family protein [Thermodesulfobacteriota bacterium]